MHLEGLCTYKQGYRNSDFTGKYSYNYVPFNCCWIDTPFLRFTVKILTSALIPTIGWSYILNWETSMTVWEIIKKQRKCWKKPGGCVTRKIWRRQKVFWLLGNWDRFIGKKLNCRIGYVMCCTKIKQELLGSNRGEFEDQVTFICFLQLHLFNALASPLLSTFAVQ